MSTVNRRRRSILKSTARNSIAPETESEDVGGGDVENGKGWGDTVEVVQGAYGNKACSTTTTVNLLPFAARKRVSFGNHHIKEFEVQVVSPSIPCTEKTVMGEVDMEMSSGDDEGGFNTTFANLEVENMPPASMERFDRTKYGGSMGVADETLFDKTCATVDPVPKDRMDLTKYGGSMGVADETLFDKTRATFDPVPKDRMDRTKYGGSMGVADETLFDKTRATFDPVPKDRMDRTKYGGSMGVADETLFDKTRAIFDPVPKDRMDRTKYGGSMGMEETLFDKTHTVFPMCHSESEDIVDKTVWGGAMTTVENSMNQTYAVPPMDLPKNHTIYGGSIEGFEETQLNHTFVTTNIPVTAGAAAENPKVPASSTSANPKVPASSTSANPKVPASSTAENPKVPASSTAANPKVPASSTAANPKVPASLTAAYLKVPASYTTATVKITESSVDAALKFTYPPNQIECGEMPVKRKRPKKAKKKPNIFAGYATPKRKFPEEDEEEKGESCPVEFQPLKKSVCKTRFSAGAQTSFAFGAYVDAQTSPFMFGKQGAETEPDEAAALSHQQKCSFTNSSLDESHDRSVSPLRSEPQTTEYEEIASPTHIAMISTRMDNVTLSNTSRENFFIPEVHNPSSNTPPPLSPDKLEKSTSPVNFEEESQTNLSTLKPPASPIPLVEESLANLSIQEPASVPLLLSEELDFFVKNSDNLNFMEWIKLSRCIRNEVVKMSQPEWEEFLTKHGHVFNRLPNYVETIIEQREIFKKFDFQVQLQSV